MEGSNQRPLMYVATHGTDDPTLATLPFLVATGAGSAEIDCCIALLSEAASVVKPGMIDAIHGVGFPPLRELVEKVKDFGIRSLRLRLVRGRPWGDRGRPYGPEGAVHRSRGLLADGRRAQRRLLLGALGTTGSLGTVRRSSLSLRPCTKSQPAWAGVTKTDDVARLPVR